MGTLGVRWAQLVRAGYKKLRVPSPYGPFTRARSMIFVSPSNTEYSATLKFTSTPCLEKLHCFCSGTGTQWKLETITWIVCFFIWWKTEVAGNWKYEGKEGLTPTKQCSSVVHDHPHCEPFPRVDLWVGIFLNLDGHDRDSEKFQQLWLKEGNNLVFDLCFGQKPMHGHFINYCSIPSWSRQ